MSESGKICCQFCGNELTEENTVGYSSVCLDCQSKQFKYLEESNGTHLAIFLCCAAFNIPCEPTICPENLGEQEGNRWKMYCDALEESGKFEKNEIPRTFFDGESNIRRIFGRGMSEKDFAKYVENEQIKTAYLPGTPEQRERWGTLDGYTTEEYNELDQMYENRASAFRGQMITDQMDYTLMVVAKWQLIAGKFLRAGDVKAASDAWKAIDAMLASECLRKKDEKPEDETLLDDFVTALEDHGLMEKGHFLSLEDTVKVLREGFVKSQNYDYSVDVIDQMILAMINAVRNNNDFQMLTELPEELQVVDEFGNFTPEETEKEIEAKKYAGLTKIHKDKK